MQDVEVIELDGTGLDGVFRSEAPRLWRALLGDPEIASDAVAEAFAQALRRGDRIV